MDAVTDEVDPRVIRTVAVTLLPCLVYRPTTVPLPRVSPTTVGVYAVQDPNLVSTSAARYPSHCGTLGASAPSGVRMPRFGVVLVAIGSRSCTDRGGVRLSGDH